jgi:L-ascorbate metabolism protein UlaG (beta-lactamase superfamily)
VSTVKLSFAAAPLPASRGPSSAGGGVSLWWLGQAGFLLETASVRLLIDPYLSDSLAIKYRGKPLDHVRMQSSPVAPEALRDIDIVLVTHGHGDHLDPGTVAPIAAHNPRCRFVVPSSCVEKALERGIPRDRLIAADAFAGLELAGVAMHPLPSAHEELVIDDHGRLEALGYVIEIGGATIYHPGDCAPYPGLLDNLSPYRIDLGLMPVNDRDAERLAAGILGNFSLKESVELAERAGFGAAIGHHFGMFRFNTIDEAAARRFLGARSGTPPFLLVEAGLRYKLEP